MWKFWKKFKSAEIIKSSSRSLRFDQIERMIEGIPTRSDQASLLFFTVHKAASSFVGRLLKRISERHQIIPVDYMEYLNSEAADFKGHPSRLILESTLEKLNADKEKAIEPFAHRKPYELYRMFPESGFCFGPLRTPDLLAALPNLERYRTLIQLRDPRDCITSMYFSKAFSHVPPPDPDKKKQFLEERQQLQEESIDDYVLEWAPRWKIMYERYSDALQNSPYLSFVKYEQMVLDFPGWLSEVERAWGFEIETRLRQRLLHEADFDVKQEDIYSHKRQVYPGDHVRKLKPETIQQLTEMFRPSLEVLDYPLEAEYSRAAA